MMSNVCVFLLLSACKFADAILCGFSTSTSFAGLSRYICNPQARNLARLDGFSGEIAVWADFCVCIVCIKARFRYLPVLLHAAAELNAENLNIHRTHTHLDNFILGACGHRLLYFYRDCRASVKLDDNRDKWKLTFSLQPAAIKGLEWIKQKLTTLIQWPARF